LTPDYAANKGGHYRPLLDNGRIVGYDGVATIGTECPMSHDFISYAIYTLGTVFIFFGLLLAINSCRMHGNVKQDENLHPALSYGVLIFFPSRLNEEGQRARKMVLFSWFGLAVSIGLILIIARLNG
jgi:hypothetical protein